MSVTARKTGGQGNTPQGKARVLNSSNPPANPTADLGSPNAGCVPPGPGTGVGGDPTKQINPAYWNCKPLGNLLLVQKGTGVATSPTNTGGCIKFRFDCFLRLKGVGILDTQGAATFNVRDNT
jgi:hypothetical protein